MAIWRPRGGTALVVLALCASALLPTGAAPASAPRIATPAPPQMIAEIQGEVEHARQRFEARDANGVLSHVSERYRSSGLTKSAVRQQIAGTLRLYEAVRARVAVTRVEIVDGDVWFYTSGRVSGRLPVVGWMTIVAWEGEPEVARREDDAWRLFGFQD